MSLKPVSIRHQTEHVPARVEFVLPPTGTGSGQLLAQDVVEIFKGRRLDSGALAALDDVAKGNLLRLDLAIAGLLLAETHLGELMTAANLDPKMQLSDIGVGAQELDAMGKALSRLFRVAVNVSQLTPSAAVKDVIALVRNQLAPAPNPVLQEVLKWPSYPAETPNQVDAATLGVMAIEKWRATCRFGLVAGRLEEFRNQITADSKADVSALLALKQDQIPAFPVGVCLLHRTWTNNLFIDFLAGNPSILGSVSGIGKALLYTVSSIAVTLRAPRIWAETSSLSAPVYEGILKRPPGSIGDQLEIGLEEAERFIRDTDDRWNVLVDRESK